MPAPHWSSNHRLRYGIVNSILVAYYFFRVPEHFILSKSMVFHGYFPGTFLINSMTLEQLPWELTLPDCSAAWNEACKMKIKDRNISFKIFLCTQLPFFSMLFEDFTKKMRNSIIFQHRKIGFEIPWFSQCAGTLFSFFTLRTHLHVC